MSKIPFNFIGVPSFFREHGWLKKPNTAAFLLWAFARCSNETKKVAHNYQEITLKPYQFIFGRRVCSEETGLTEMEVRIQVNSMINAGYLKNATNKTTKRYTIYEWSTEIFSENNNQQNNHQTTNRQPTDNHNQDHRYDIDLIDYDLIDNACAREKKREGEKIINLENANPVDESRLIVAKKKNSNGLTSIRLNALHHELLQLGFSAEEIAQGLDAFEEKDRHINGTITKYIQSIINNQRLKKEKEELKKIQENKSNERTQDPAKSISGKYKNGSGTHSRRYSEQDYFQWTRDAAKESSIRYPTEA